MHHPHQIAFGDGVLYCGQAKAKPEAQLGESKAKQKKEPREGRLVAIPNQSQLFYTLTITPNRVRSVVWG